MPRIVKGDWMKLEAPIERKKKRDPKKTIGVKPTDAIYQLKVVLKHTKPLIWRRLKVRAGISLGELHFVLQAAMGWDDCHQHVFEAGDVSYAPAVKKDTADEAEDENLVDLKIVAPVLKSKFTYDYDMGDDWLHLITVEKILSADPDQKLPVCTAASGACPPEDCGGLWGYYAMLDILEEPHHPEYKRMRTWVGDGFDPETVDLASINKRLNEFQKL